MLAFVICIGLLCSALGFALAVAIVGPTAYENGWKARGHHEHVVRSDRERTGWRVVS